MRKLECRESKSGGLYNSGLCGVGAVRVIGDGTSTAAISTPTGAGDSTFCGSAFSKFWRACVRHSFTGCFPFGQQR